MLVQWYILFWQNDIEEILRVLSCAGNVQVLEKRKYMFIMTFGMLTDNVTPVNMYHGNYE